MGFREQLEEKAALVGDSARTVATSDRMQRVGDGFRGLRALFADQDRPLSVEGFLLALVRAVRDDERVVDASRRDIYVLARKRRRKLAVVSFGAGPLVGVANQLSDLYCETAIICDLGILHRLSLSDEQVAAHMLVLWAVVEDIGVAEQAITGEPSLTRMLGTKLRDRANEQLPDRLTKRSITNALWDVRNATGEVRRGGLWDAIRTVLFTGHRTKNFIKRAEVQLGVGD